MGLRRHLEPDSYFPVLEGGGYFDATLLCEISTRHAANAVMASSLSLHGAARRE